MNMGRLYIMQNFTYALVHRSLNWNSPIRVFIFDNRIEIHSPGTLPNGLSVDDIIAGVSMPRNNFLFTNAMYLLPYTGAGSGIQRALELDSRITFSNNGQLHEFLITITRDNSSTNLNSDTLNSDTLNADSDTSCVDSDTIEPNSDTFRMKLSKKQIDIVNFCSVPRSSREILERAGVTYHSKNIQNYITALVDNDYLEMTNPDNPNASNQKYRKAK